MLGPIALAQLGGFFVVTERSERVCCDAGGVLGPGVVWFECFIVGGEGAIAECRGFTSVA